MDYLKRALAIQGELLANRRYLHVHPEIGMELLHTPGFVEEKLREMGYVPKRVGKSGVCATVGSKEGGRVLLLRADMDALPMKEQSGLPYASSNGCAHTCGHDFHTSMLLGAAKMLKETEAQLAGTVKLMFQPGEEIMAGARVMLESGILEDPHVDAAMAGHILPMLPTGYIGYHKGIMAASSDSFTISVHGKGCHGARPHEGVDPISAAAHLVLALQELFSREIDPEEAAVLTIGSFHAGKAPNVIPETALLSGTLRAWREEVRTFSLHRLREIASHTAEVFRARAQVKIEGSNCALRVDEKIADVMGNAWKKMLGNDGHVVDMKMNGSEDFAEIAARVPAMFFVLGGMDPNNQSPYGLHHPKVTFDENSLAFGAAAYAQGAAAWLEWSSMR